MLHQSIFFFFFSEEKKIAGAIKNKQTQKKFLVKMNLLRKLKFSCCSVGSPSPLLPGGASESACVSSFCCARRSVLLSSDVVDHPPYRYRQRHTYRTLPLHDASRFGGRSSYLREIGPFDHKRKGRLFKRNAELSQWNVDVWAAQQTLRKKWKGRDWVVMEVPFLCSPRALQRVIPEMFTDLPPLSQSVDHPKEIEEARGTTSRSACAAGDGSAQVDQRAISNSKNSGSSCSYTPPEDDRFYRFQSNNLRHKVFDIEELQPVLFRGPQNGDRLPYPSICKVDTSALTLEKFL